MVVSCQKRVICFLAFLFVLFTPLISFAAAEELTDKQLDMVSAGSILDVISKLLTNPSAQGNPLGKSLAALDHLFDQALLGSSGLVRVNAVNSNVSIQANMVFLLEAQGITINLSNVYESK